MKWLSFACLCLMGTGTFGWAAPRCPAIETSMVNRGFADSAPWRVMSGGIAECSFTTAKTSVNFGFSHIVSSSIDEATKSAVEMRAAVAPTSLIEPMPVLGEEGFTYQQKKDTGNVDPTSMFFYGHRGTLNVSGYLNLKGPITPAQRDFAAQLIATTLGVASSPKALAKETDCRWLDAQLVDRLLPGQGRSVIVTDANNCVVSASSKVIVVAVTTDPRTRSTADLQLQSGGCTVDPLPRLGNPAGLAHHCSEGNPRAEVLFVSGSRMIKLTYISAGEPTADDKSALLGLAEFARRR